MANWYYWGRRSAEMASDFVGFQGTPAAFGNAMKTQIEDQNTNYAEWSLAMAGLLQSSAAVSAQIVSNPAWLTTGIEVAGVRVAGAIPGQRGQRHLVF